MERRDHVREACRDALVSAFPYRDRPSVTAVYVDVFGGAATDCGRTRSKSAVSRKPLDGLGSLAFVSVAETLRPGRWMNVAPIVTELRKLVSVDFNKHVRFVEDYDAGEDRPVHQLELLNDTARGTHWFLVLHSRQADGSPDAHYVLDPLGLPMRPAAKRKYGSGWRWEEKDPIPTLFGVGRRAVLQDNAYDCGPGACLLAQAVVEQFGRTGASEGRVGLLETPLRCVRMQMALQYLLFRLTPVPAGTADPADVIVID